MALDVACGSFTAPTSAATDTVLTPGFQAKLIIVLATLATANDTFTDDAAISLGMASGTATANQWAIGTNYDDNVGTSAGASEIYDGIVAIPTTGGSSALWAARVSAISSTQVTIDWSTVGATGIICEYLILGGDLEAQCGRSSLAASTGVQSFTTTFQPDTVLTATGAENQTATGRVVGFARSIGAMRSSTERWSYANRARIAQTMATAIDADGSYRSDITFATLTNSEAYDSVADFSSLGVTSFALNFSDAPAAANLLCWTALRGAAMKLDASNKANTGSPTTQDFTAGFPVKAVFTVGGGRADTTSVQSTPARASHGVASASAQGSTAFIIGDAINTQANCRASSSKFLTIANAGVTPSLADEATVDLSGTVANGIRITWNPSSGNGALTCVLMFGDAPAPATSGAVTMAARGIASAPTWQKDGTTAPSVRGRTRLATVPSKPTAGTADFTNISGQSLIPGLPSGWQPDDIHILLFGHKAGGQMASLSGWTQIQAQTNGSAVRAEAWWRRAQVGDTDPTVSLSNNAVTTTRGARIFGVRGCPTPDDPFDGGSIQSNASGTTVAFSDITTTVENDFILALVVYADDPTDVSTMSGFTEPADAVSSYDANPFMDDSRSAMDADNILMDGSSGAAMLAYEWRAVATPGASGATSLTVSGGTFSSALSLGILIAVKTRVAVSAPATSGTVILRGRPLLNGSGAVFEITPIAPVGDIAADSWTTELGASVSLYASIDELQPSDADYIISPAPSATPYECKVRLAPMAVPLADELVSVSYRHWKDSAGGPAENLRITLYAANGTTVIASWDHFDIETTHVSTEQVLTEAQVASIPSGDYATGLVLGFRAVEG